MKSRLSYIISFIGLSVAFWACSDGEIYTASAEDLIAVEKLGNMTEEEYAALMEECRADSKCRAEMEKYPAPTSSNEPEPISSSSEKKPESSSEDESSSVDSSADTTVSSSGKVPESSSSKVVDESSSSVESSAESSSDKSKESSSSEKTPSSSEDSSSSSVESSSEESSSSEQKPASSSSEPVTTESSSSEESSSSLLPPHGTCVLTNSEGKSVTTVKLNEPVTWTYVPDEGTSEDVSFKWFFDVDYSKIEGSVTSLPFKMKFTDYGGGEAALTYNNGKDKACSLQMKVSGVYEPSSSSDNGDTPVDPDQSYSSDSKSSSSGGKPGICQDGDASCGPEPSSSDKSSSSSEASSSSENGGSGDGVQEISEIELGKEYPAGSYVITGNAGSKQCDVRSSSADMHSIFTFPQGSGGGIQAWNNAEGQVKLAPSTEIFFDSGYLKFTNCW